MAVSSGSADILNALSMIMDREQRQKQADNEKSLRLVGMAQQQYQYEQNRIDSINKEMREKESELNKLGVSLSKIEKENSGQTSQGRQIAGIAASFIQSDLDATRGRLIQSEEKMNQLGKTLSDVYAGQEFGMELYNKFKTTDSGTGLYGLRTGAERSGISASEFDLAWDEASKRYAEQGLTEDEINMRRIGFNQAIKKLEQENLSEGVREYGIEVSAMQGEEQFNLRQRKERAKEQYDANEEMRGTLIDRYNQSVKSINERLSINKDKNISEWHSKINEIPRTTKDVYSQTIAHVEQLANTLNKAEDMNMPDIVRDAINNFENADVGSKRRKAAIELYKTIKSNLIIDEATGGLDLSWNPFSSGDKEDKQIFFDSFEAAGFLTQISGLNALQGKYISGDYSGMGLYQGDSDALISIANNSLAGKPVEPKLIPAQKKGNQGGQEGQGKQDNTGFLDNALFWKLPQENKKDSNPKSNSNLKKFEPKYKYNKDTDTTEILNNASTNGNKTVTNPEKIESNKIDTDKEYSREIAELLDSMNTIEPNNFKPIIYKYDKKDIDLERNANEEYAREIDKLLYEINQQKYKDSVDIGSNFNQVVLESLIDTGRFVERKGSILDALPKTNYSQYMFDVNQNRTIKRDGNLSQYAPSNELSYYIQQLLSGQNVYGNFSDNVISILDSMISNNSIPDDSTKDDRMAAIAIYAKMIKALNNIEKESKVNSGE